MSPGYDSNKQMSIEHQQHEGAKGAININFDP